MIGAALAGATGVLFDIDDTLVDTRAAFAHALAGVAARYLPGVPPQAYPDLLATWRADVGSYYSAFTRGEITHLEQRRARADELHQVHGDGPMSDAEFAAWNSCYDEEFASAWRAFDDAVTCVRAVRAAGLAVGTLSNASAAQQRQKLAVTGLDELAPLLVSVDTFGFGKPDPRVFAEACRLLGTEPGETVYVGDDLAADARGAMAAGLRAVWLDRPGTRRGGSFSEDADAARAEGITVIAGLGELGVLGELGRQ